MFRTTGRAVLVATMTGAVLVVGFGGNAGAKASTVKVTIDDEGCPANVKANAGPITFKVSNKGSSGDVSEFEVLAGDRILGEVENVAPGLSRDFSLTLKAGDYVTKCPGGSKRSTGKLVVAGAADTKLSADAQAAVDTYRQYLVAQTAELVTATKAFTAAVDSGDLAQAKALYAPSRVAYERIEPVAETFGDLDPRIDARDGDVPKKEWGGYHYIEQKLWVDGTTSGLTGSTADLNADVQTLANLVKDVDLQPAGIANGAVELLNEVSKSKITGEEERYSRTDLVDFEANVQGAEAAYNAVKPILQKKNPRLASELDTKFADVYAALQPYQTGATTYVAYTDLTKVDTKKLSQVIDSLAEPLSKVSKQVVGS
jgi:iron uptake system EfeUOB component EfeO/EfeM